ncbi:Sorting nexin member 21 [Desmophyllum pertusum]|uniref:Sorting nexin member 21 n=1 Tax=Desmophyllum pertusum TaxID=174260 RepID=A0A9W9Z7F1_9CNID|nr:Sorting nexin member 21 [Desmophyllum pertusum]
MGSFWYFDETEISPDDPDHSAPDNISFNGQLVNHVGPTICAAEKGVVYVDSDTSEDEDLDTLNSTCRGHGISVFSDPHNVTFQIVKTKIHDESKRVIYYLMVLRTDLGIDTEKVTVQRRYSNFASLYKALKKDHPTFLKDVNFPGKVFGHKSNVNPDLIESRRIAFQAFLQTIYKHKEVRQHQAFKDFFYLPGLKEATDNLKGGQLENCLELLLNSLHLQVKLCDEVREIIATLGAIVVVLEAQGKLEDAERYATAALELGQDDYLCDYMIPLLDTAAQLRWKLQMDKKTIERHLIHVQKMSGAEADHVCTLQELAVKRFDKDK